MSSYVKIEWLTPKDYSDIEDLELDSVGGTSHNNFYPESPNFWPLHEYQRVLAKVHTKGALLKLGSEIVGVAVYTTSKFNTQVEKFLIHPEYRRLKMGTIFMHHLLGLRRSTGIRVWECSIGAQLFLRRLGFHYSSMIRDFYAIENNPASYHFVCTNVTSSLLGRYEDIDEEISSPYRCGEEGELPTN